MTLKKSRDLFDNILNRSSILELQIRSPNVATVASKIPGEISRQITVDEN